MPVQGLETLDTANHPIDCVGRVIEVRERRAPERQHPIADDLADFAVPVFTDG